MQISFYRFLKNSLILKNLEPQPTLPNGLIFSQHKEKKINWGNHDKNSNIQSSDQSSQLLVILAYKGKILFLLGRAPWVTKPNLLSETF